MSGLVKSVDPEEMAAQEVRICATCSLALACRDLPLGQALVIAGKASFRTTVMFSATMAPPVEKLAKDYLRAPVIVSIGDQESSRNKRIVQEVLPPLGMLVDASCPCCCSCLCRSFT